MPLPERHLAEMAGYTERELLLLVLSTLHDQGVILSRLDESVAAVVTETDRVLSEVVTDLRNKLAQAQADDATAADVAADVEENVARLDELANRLRSEFPAETGGEPTDPNAPVEGQPGDPGDPLNV